MDPSGGQFFLRCILRQAITQAIEIHVIELLVLIEARKDYGVLPGIWVDVALQALGANFLHHALHRGIY